MAASNYTHGAASTQDAQQHTAAHDKLSSRVEALGRFARYRCVWYLPVRTVSIRP